MSKNQLKFLIRFLKSNGVYSDFLKGAKERNMRYVRNRTYHPYGSENVYLYLLKMNVDDAILYALDWCKSDGGTIRWDSLYGMFKLHYIKHFKQF